MKVLITGANGFLGQQLTKALVEQGHVVLATGIGPQRVLQEQSVHFKYIPIDLGTDEPLEKFMEMLRPEVVIHAAAMTQVDACELDREKSYRINVDATRRIVAASESLNSFLIFISSDFVFDGHKGNYLEDDPLSAVNWYGHTKIQAERLVQACISPWAIVRTCLVYGNCLDGSRNNIITWTRQKLMLGEKIQVVDDQIRTPTHVEDLARGILLLMEKPGHGVFHIAGKDTMSPYDMARHAADQFGLDAQLIERVNGSSFIQPAVRPLITGLSIDKSRKLLGYEPMSFLQGLVLMKTGARPLESSD